MRNPVLLPVLAGLLAGVIMVAPAAALDEGKPLAAGLSARLAQVQSAPCQCLANNRAFDEGQVTCLKTADGPRLATCGMAQNVMSWEFSSRPCPDS